VHLHVQLGVHNTQLGQREAVGGSDGGVELPGEQGVSDDAGSDGRGDVVKYDGM
jgi:hypothetical protein